MLGTHKHVLSIRRLVAVVLVLICIGINALAALYVTCEHKLIEETITAVTSEHGRAWAQICQERILENDAAGLQRVVQAIGNGESVQLAMVIGENGHVLAATDPQRIGERHQIDHDVLTRDEPQVEELHPEPTGFFHEEGHTFDFYFPIHLAGNYLGGLIVHVNTAWGNQQAKALALKWMLILLVLTLFVGAAAIGLDRRIRRAVQALITATKAIAHGERNPELNIGTGDELDVLGASVRQMAGALQNTEQRVKHWHRELEKTIAERTAQLEQSQQRLAEREKMAALGLMAAGIVHEIGNPLTAMSTIVQRLEGKADARFSEPCRTLGQQIERISKIVNDMRQVARPVSANGSATNVNETLGVAIKIARYDPRAKTIEIVPYLSAEVPRIPGDADRWQQVFMNLIINALDAMPHGGKLLVSSSIGDGRVAITFRDSGSGMSAEQLGQLYHPFYSTKACHGMGLGLSVCHSIVRSYGGEIVVESEVGKGTEFRITISPYRRRSRTEASRATQADNGQVPSVASGRDEGRAAGEVKA